MSCNSTTKSKKKKKHYFGQKEVLKTESRSPNDTNLRLSSASFGCERNDIPAFRETPTSPEQSITFTQ